MRRRAIVRAYSFDAPRLIPFLQLPPLPRQPRELLHPPQQGLVLAPLGQDLADVGAFEDAALEPGGEHRGHVLPALVLLERLDLAMQPEEIITEVGVHAEPLERGVER